MWFIPILVIGAIVVAASRSPREESVAPRQLASGPGPIFVLSQFMRRGQHPPPTVVLCALAEAETLGRDDVASDIIRLFVAPVVYRNQAPSRRAHPAIHRHTVPPAPVPAPGAVAVESAEVTETPQTTTRLATDEEIRAMLNSDPQKFVEMAARGGVPVIEVPIEAVLHSHVPAARPEAAAVADAHESERPVPGSPLEMVSDGAWCEFVGLLEREAPGFSSSRHVGQYRQRRERLAELGIDPAAIEGSSEAQRAALDIDLVDAHHHATEGGLVQYLGRSMAVPGGGAAAPLTLSGLLGVIQCAGLEGAVGWLEHVGDRKRYPHTTQAFLRTNGVF